MRHDPAAGAVVIMLRSLKMHGMAQAVGELTEQGSPAFEAALPILSQLLKAETADREVRSTAYQLKAARFPSYRDLAGFDFACHARSTRRSSASFTAASSWRTTTTPCSSAGRERAKRISQPPSASRPSSITASACGSSLADRTRQRARTRKTPRQTRADRRTPRLLRSRHSRRAWLPRGNCKAIAAAFSASGGALLFHLLEPSSTSAPASSSPRTSASANGQESSANRMSHDAFLFDRLVRKRRCCN